MTRRPVASRSFARRVLGLAGWLATLALVVYHLYLFAGRLRDATLARPEVGLRWAMAFALAALAAIYRRRGLSLWRGRPALVFWVLALLLHLGPIPVPALAEPAAPLLTALPWGFALALAALVALAGSEAARRPTPAPRARPPIAALGSAPPLALRFSPRPPPAA